MTFVAAIAMLAVAADPRIPLVELQRSGEVKRALVEVDASLASDPATANALGLPLLRGELLERLGRPSEAASAYAEAIGATPDLAPWARRRLAATQAALGHPEVAAGVAATLLAQGAPERLVGPALELLFAGLQQGGDCRLLGGLTARSWAREPGRRIEVALAECELRRGERTAAAQRLETLLLAEAADLAALDAAELWIDRLELPTRRETLHALGEALAAQRDFVHAIPVLEAALADEPRSGSVRESATLYRLARAQFWLEQFGRAARTFEELGRTTRSVAMRADARYQLARCHELSGDRAAAAALYLEAFDLEPRGEWAGTSLLARLRLDWIDGRRLEAVARLDQLGRDRAFRSPFARGAIFLATSEIVAGVSTPQVLGWLDAIERSDASSPEEVAYWRGRAAEIDLRLDDAVSAYTATQRSRPFHPLAQAARRRLLRPELAERAASKAVRSAAGESVEAMETAWILFGPNRPQATFVRARGLSALSNQPGLPVWIRWSPRPVADWPLFRQSPTSAEERLLMLGLFRDGAAGIARHFPARAPELAFTASHLLQIQGQTGQGIQIAEGQFERRPVAIREDWVSADLRRLLYPLPYRTSLLAQSSLRRIDVWLLTAILREESRFRPDAISPAGARGIAQLTLPTARRLSRLLGLSAEVRISDLHRPEVSIPLAAAYVSELSGRFEGIEPAMLAAYNAGEAQTDLWRSYCTSAEPEELLAKIGFRETRAYVMRVLESRAHYASLYAF